MEWKSWSSLPLTQRERLPAQSGIYVVVDAEEQIWYVGRSVNLNARWNGKGHHRYQQLSRTNGKRQYQIHWKCFPPTQLDEKEQFYIDLFKPHLNYSRVRTYARKSIQPHEEISRLLKVINQKTTLFPDVRSVVLGYYTEVDEDEEGTLKEYTCIIIVINVNDHDGPILNSYQKSFSRKGSNLKGCWQTYENKCGDDNPDIRPAFIPVFLFENIVYEFVCYPDVIEKLSQNKAALHSVEIAKQPVLALQDMTILPSLVVPERQFIFRTEDYLRYRVPELQPILQLLTREATG